MSKKLKQWVHFLSCFALFTASLVGFIPWNISPFISFSSELSKKKSLEKGLWVQFFIGFLLSAVGSSLKFGTFSLLLCLNFLTLYPLRRFFIDDHLISASLYAALFGLSFAFGEFFLHQIFYSDLPFQTGLLLKGFFNRFLIDFLFSFAILSWLFFLEFFILKGKKILYRWMENRKENKSHA